MSNAFEKVMPKVGDHCYLRQFTGSYYVDMVKRPYTVIEVTPSKVVVQACQLIYPIFHYDENKMSDYYKQFDGKRICFYDTIAESIIEDKSGDCEELTWHAKKGLWGTAGRKDSEYPEYAIIGKWEHQPYLD